MDANRIIEALGGTSKVAELCRIKPPSVSGWRRKGIPPYRLDFLRLACPDVFSEIEPGGSLECRPPKEAA